MSLQYVVYDYWEYGYAEGDAILEFGSASVSAQATVTSGGIRIKTGSGSVTGNAAVSAQGGILRFANASVNANAIVTADGIRVQTGIASITGAATVSALGGVVYSGFGAITGVASVSASPNAILAGNAAITGSASITVNGIIIGDEWVDAIPGTNTWAQVEEITNTWTPVVSGSNFWVNSRFFDPYVEIDYWEDNYADDRYDYWVKESSTQDNWTRQ